MVGARHAVPLLDSGACPGPDPGFAGMTEIRLFRKRIIDQPGKQSKTGLEIPRPKGQRIYNSVIPLLE